MKRLIGFLFALLGFGVVGCMRVEYGTPHVSFSLSARVVDEAGKPIEGIEARVASEYRDEGIPFENRTGVSNYLGEIDAVSGTMWPGFDHGVIFLDPDGEANGGKFESKFVDISGLITQTEEGSGSWYGGAFNAELGDVVMMLEEESADDDNQNNEEE